MYGRTTEKKNNIRATEYLPMTPNNLWDNDGARKKFKIVGRGNGSGKGKTCGRGMNGQKSRPGTGKLRPSLLGGQNPLNKRIPKRGFNRHATKDPLEEINIRNIVYYVKKNRLDASKPITMKDLFECGALSKIRFGVKVLGKGAEELATLGVPLHLEVSNASQSAIDAVKAAGGSITVVHFTETTLRRFLKPHKFAIPEAKIPMPPPKTVLKYESLRDKGLEVRYPKAPWYEEWKAQKERELKEFEAREKTAGEKILPVYPVPRYPGMSLNVPKVEKEELVKNVRYPLP